MIQHLKIELFGFSMDALTAVVISYQGHGVIETIDHGGHGAHEMDNLEKRKYKDTKTKLSQLPMAYFLVQSLAFLSASASFVFHNSATSLASGSSGLGAERRAWMERRTVLI